MAEQDGGPDLMERVKRQRQKVRVAMEAEAWAKKAYVDAKARLKGEQALLGDIIDGKQAMPLFPGSEEEGGESWSGPDPEPDPPRPRRGRKGKKEVVPGDEFVPGLGVNPDGRPVVFNPDGQPTLNPGGDWREIRLDKIGVTKRAVTALAESNIHTVGQISDMAKKGLRLDDVKGISTATAAAIDEALVAFMDARSTAPGEEG